MRNIFQMVTWLSLVSMLFAGGCTFFSGGPSDDDAIITDTATTENTESDNGDGPAYGSCSDMDPTKEPGLCREFEGDAWAEDDDTPMVTGEFLCNAMAGTYSATEPCDPTGLVGVCLNIENEATANAETNEFYYASHWTLATAEDTCAGEWTPVATTGNGDGPEYGSCSVMAETLEPGQCHEFEGDGWRADDDTPDLTGENECLSMGGTYSATAACYTGELVGVCLGVELGADARSTQFFYKSQWDLATAEAECTGEWSPVAIEIDTESSTDSDTGEARPFYGSCGESTLDPGQCLQYVGWVFGDASSPAHGPSACGWFSGEFSWGRCTTTGLVGVCRYGNQIFDPQTEFDTFFYDSHYDATNAEAECTCSACVWEPASEPLVV